MHGGLLHGLVGRLRQAVGRDESAAPTDAELLRRWVRGRDEAAFELLVWRHGRLVLSVCRRLLPDAQDAEDAFQATFLVLVRKAAGIARRQAVASWLHTVAYRIALQARSRPSRRERGGADLLDRLEAPPGTPPGANDLRRVLDEEVGRLPEKYRVPFVLCCLQGRTNEEAARELGRPVGTILSRLSRARQRLRERLARRGLAPAALAGPALLGEAGVSAGMVSSTVKAATAVGAAKAALGAASAPAVALMEGALQAMFVAKMKTAAAVVATVAILGVGGTTVGYRATYAQGRPDPNGDRLTAGQGAAKKATGRASAEEEIARLRDELTKAQITAKVLADRLQQMLDAEKKNKTDPLLRTNPGTRADPFRRADPAISKPITTLDPEDLVMAKSKVDAFKAEVEAAKAEVEAGRKRQARMERLAKQNLVAQEELEEAHAKARVAEAHLRISEARLVESMAMLEKVQRSLRVNPDRAVQPLPNPRMTFVAPEVESEELEILRARLDAKKAELEASKSMQQESERRLSMALKARNAIGPDELAFARVTAERYALESKAKEAELREQAIRLKHAERRLKSAPAGGSLEQRVRELEEKVERLEKELRGRRELDVAPRR